MQGQVPLSSRVAPVVSTSSADLDKGDEQKPECGNCLRAKRGCVQSSHSGLDIHPYHGPGHREHRRQSSLVSESTHQSAPMEPPGAQNDETENSGDVCGGHDAHEDAGTHQAQWLSPVSNESGQTYPWLQTMSPTGPRHDYDPVSPQPPLLQAQMPPAALVGATVSISSLLRLDSASPMGRSPGVWAGNQSTSPQIPVPEHTALAPGEARLVHHYAMHLGRWLDCTDASRQFSLKIPALVRSSPILRLAVVSFAARHLGDTTTADAAHEECIHMLIGLLDSDTVAQDDNLLCAIVILRVYEQLSGTSAVPSLARLLTPGRALG